MSPEPDRPLTVRDVVLCIKEGVIYNKCPHDNLFHDRYNQKCCRSCNRVVLPLYTEGGIYYMSQLEIITVQMRTTERDRYEQHGFPMQPTSWYTKQ